MSIFWAKFIKLCYNKSIEWRKIMKVYKKELPKNVRKMFKYEKGVKVKVLNSLYYGKKKQK